jgi:hypothetical protein
MVTVGCIQWEYSVSTTNYLLLTTYYYVPAICKMSVEVYTVSTVGVYTVGVQCEYSGSVYSGSTV